MGPGILNLELHKNTDYRKFFEFENFNLNDYQKGRMQIRNYPGGVVLWEGDLAISYSSKTLSLIIPRTVNKDWSEGVYKYDILLIPNPGKDQLKLVEGDFIVKPTITVS